LVDLSVLIGTSFYLKQPPMKTLKKLMVVACTIAALFFTTQTKAQTTPANAFRFGIGIDAADPTGNARIGTTFILGGTARVQYGVSNNFAITLTSGAYHFFPKINPATNVRYGSYGVIPIKAGIKVFFAQNVYFGAEGGAGIEVTSAGSGPTRLILSPAIGYANEHWDFGARYENFSGGQRSYGLVGLRIAYGFAL
jgi:hypothetical protein